MRKFNLTAKQLAAATAGAPRKPLDSDIATTNMMLDPRYLRQSSSLIQDALQKGFDVLQLANGDIVTTGTKTVVHQYAWDDEKGKLIKAKPDARKTKKTSGNADEVSIDAEMIMNAESGGAMTEQVAVEQVSERSTETEQA